ncbi:hypothetical protein [Vogesella sp. LIG4]|uniref:hypothetical protein n=1 Tax=Vogesella sp. LIG4 TaxID=1192162 RepID=UPI0008200F68|nr:hypothetical protein [Vogesella sp. LIG4]SCK24712.1 hypothetical protein PSELUDRAFT_2913 [Vogesella sp. LIG4]
MDGLVLSAGGKLTYYHLAANLTHGQAPACSEASHHAAAYLAEAVRFDGEIHLRDIFLLLAANPVLLEEFARLHAAAFLAEARQGIATPYSGEYDPDGIEYLELFYHREPGADTAEAADSTHLWLRAIGYELREDSQQNGSIEYRKGSRITWSIMFLPLTDILNLPLRFNPEVSMDEDARDSGLPHRLLAGPPSLGQVIGSVLQELAFNGGPEERAERARQLFDTPGK